MLVPRDPPPDYVRQCMSAGSAGAPDVVRQCMFCLEKDRSPAELSRKGQKPGGAVSNKTEDRAGGADMHCRGTLTTSGADARPPRSAPRTCTVAGLRVFPFWISGRYCAICLKAIYSQLTYLTITRTASSGVVKVVYDKLVI